MATQVDQRVVQMQFDNKQFEAGIQETLQSLNKLNATIEENTQKTGKQMFSGMESQLSRANSSFDQMNGSLDVMTKKFSALGTISDQVLRNIGNSVSGFLHQGLSLITSGPRSGFKEYEDMMGSVQTIMAGTGESVERVNQKLDELNTYSDETIYKFQDMTSNIGKFTNQGVDLDTAVASMKGIANEAAISGANAQQASHAMYNFAQALSSGYTKLIDWKSIENSMMATVEFKNTLLQTAEALGKVTKVGNQYETVTTNMKGKTSDLFNAQKGFNDSLQYQWLTNDTLTTALELYATDVRDLTDAEVKEYEAKLKGKGFTDKQIKQFEALGMKAADAAKDVKTFSMLVDTLGEAIGSGWTQSFRTVIGDFEEAKGLWTGLSNILGDLISKVSDYRNNMLKGWKDAGGRMAMLQTLANVLNAVWSVLNPIKEAAQEIFGAFDGAQTLVSITDFIERFTRGLILSTDQMEELKAVAKTAFAVIKTGLEVIMTFRKPILSFLLITTGLKAIQSLFTGGLGLNTLVSLFKILMSFGLLKTVLGINGAAKDTETRVGGVASAVGSLAEKSQSLISKLSSSKIIQGIVKGLRVAAAILEIVVGAAVAGISILINKIRSLDFNSIKNNLSAIGIVFSKIKDSIVSFISKVSGSNDIFGSIARGLMIAGAAVTSFVSAIGSLIRGETDLTGAFDKIKSSISSVTSTFSSGFRDASTKVGGFGQIAGASSDKVTILGRAFEKSQPAIEQSQTILETIIAHLKAFSQNADAAVASAGEANTVVGKFVDTVAKIDWQKLLAAGYIFLFIRYLKKLSDTINKFSNDFSTLGGSVKQTLGSIQDYFKSIVSLNGAKKFRDIAIGIGILTAALFALAAVPLDPQRIDQAAATIMKLSITVTGCVAGLEALTAGLSKKIDKKGLATLSAAMVSLTGVLVVLGVELGVTAVAVNILYNHIQSGKEYFTRLVAPILILVGGFVALGVAIALFAKNAEGISKATGSMLKIAGSIAALAGAIILFNTAIQLVVAQASLFLHEMNLVGKLLTAHLKALMLVRGNVVGFISFFAQIAFAVGAFVVTIVGIISIVKIFNKVTKETAASIALLSLALIGMSVAISILGSMLGSPIKALGGVVTGLLGLVGVLAILSSPQFNQGFMNLNLVAKSMIALSGAFALLALSIAVFGRLKPTTIIKGIILVGGSMLALSIAMKKMDGIKMEKIASTMLALAAAMAILAPIMALVGILARPMAVGGTIIAGMMLALAESVKLMGQAKPINVIFIVGAMILAIKELGSLVMDLAKLPIDKSITAAAELAGMMLALGFAMKLASNAMAQMQGFDAVGMSAIILSFTAAIYVMSQAITALAGIQNIDAALAAAASLSIVMLTFSLSIAAISSVVQGFTAMDMAAFAVSVVSFGAAMGILSMALVQLASQPVEGVVAAAAAINISMIVFAGAMAVMMTVGQQMSVLSSLGISVMMISFASSIVILAAAMTIMAQIPADRLTQVAIVMGVLMGVMTLMIGVVGHFGAGLMLATPAILAFAAVVLSIGAAFVAFGAGAALFGVGANLVAQGIAAVVSAITLLLPQVTIFITSMVALSNQAGNLAKMAGSLTLVGLSLIAIGAGGGAAGLGLMVFAGGLAAVGVVITTVGSAVLGLFVTLQSVAEAAANWGRELAQKIADGINAGIDAIRTAASNIASAIASFLHFSTPDEGPLADSDSWMPDFVSLLSGGLKKGVPQIKAAAGDLAGGIEDGLNLDDAKKNGEEYGEDTAAGLDSTKGDAQNAGENVGSAASSGVTKGADAKNTGESSIFDFIKGIISGEVPASDVMTEFGGMAKDKLSGAFDGQGTGAGLVDALKQGSLGPLNSLVSMFGSFGSAAGQAFASTAHKWIAASEKVLKADAASLQAAPQYSNAGYRYKEGNTVKNRSGTTIAKIDVPFSSDDFMSQVRSLVGGSKDKGTDTSTGGGGGSSSGKKGSGGGSSKSTKDNTKALQEFQNTLDKFNERAIPIINNFSTSFGAMMSTVADKGAYEIGAEGFELLLDKIYQASDKADEVYEDSDEKGTALQQKANAIREAFVEAFDKISQAIQGSLDFYTEFDKKTSDMVKPDKLIMNAKSQVSALKEATDALTSLAYRGVSDTVLSDLGSNPLENYTKIMELRQMSNEDLKEFIGYQEQSTKLADEATARVEEARMVALYLNEAKENGLKTYDNLDDVTKAYVNVLQEENKVKAAGLTLDSQAFDHTNLDKAYMELKKYADAANMSLVDLYTQLSQTVDSSNILKTVIISGIQEAYTQFDSAMSKISEYEAKAKEFGASMKEAIEGFGGAFESLDISSDASGKQLLSNLENRIAGVKDLQYEILSLRQRGLNQEALEELISQGQGAVMAAGKMGDDWIKSINKSYKDYKDAITVSSKEQDLFEKYSLWVEKNTNEDYQNEIKNAEKAKKKISDLNKEYNNLNLSAEDMDKQAADAASKAVNNIAGAVDDSKEAVKEAAKDLGASTVTEFTKSVNDTLLGDNLDIGVSGIFGDAYEGISEVSNEFLMAALNYDDYIAQVGADNDTAKTAFNNLSEAAKNYGITEEQLGVILGNRSAVQSTLTNNIVKSFDKVFKKATESSKLVEQFKLTANQVGDSIKSVLDNTNLYAELSDNEDKISGDELIKRMRGNLDKAEKELQNYLALEAKGLNAGLLQQLADQGPEYLEAATSWTSDQVSNANAMYERATTIGDDAKAKASAQWLNAGTMNGQTYKQALDTALTDVSSLANTVQTMATNFSTVVDPALIQMGTEAAALFGQSIQTALTNNSATIAESSKITGTTITENLSSGMQTGYKQSEGNVTNASKDIANKATEEIDKKVNSEEGKKKGTNYAHSMVQSVEGEKQNMYNAGSDLMQGLMDGIRSKKEEFDNLCQEIASEFADTVSKMNQIGSPSKVMYKIGQFMDEGYLRGLESGADGITESANNIGSIVNAAMSVVNPNSQPTITPVVDYSNIYASQGLISQMYGNGFGINLNPSLGAVTTPKDAELNRLNGMFGKISNADVVSAIMSLRGDISSLGNAVSQMQIVLDSGEIAGAVTNGVSQNINNAVGRRESVWA